MVHALREEISWSESGRVVFSLNKSLAEGGIHRSTWPCCHVIVTWQRPTLCFVATSLTKEQINHGLSWLNLNFCRIDQLKSLLEESTTSESDSEESSEEGKRKRHKKSKAKHKKKEKKKHKDKHRKLSKNTDSDSDSRQKYSKEKRTKRWHSYYLNAEGKKQAKS